MVANYHKVLINSSINSKKKKAIINQKAHYSIRLFFFTSAISQKSKNKLKMAVNNFSNSLLFLKWNFRKRGTCNVKLEALLEISTQQVLGLGPINQPTILSLKNIKLHSSFFNFLKCRLQNIYKSRSDNLFLKRESRGSNILYVQQRLKSTIIFITNFVILS